ncbi:MAG: hypothetical protein Q9200_002642 [Gallowayella weberi]
MELFSAYLPSDLPWLEISTAIVCVVFAYSLAIIAIPRILSESEEAPVDYFVPLPVQCKPGWTGRTLEDPSIKIPGSSAIQCYNPATGQLLGQVNPATPDGIDRAVARATDAQKEWAKTTFKQRRKVLRTILKYVEARRDIATVACLDSGKTKVDAMLGEILVTVEKLKWTIQHGEKALRPEQRPTNFLMLYKHNEVRWEPLGVLAACVSWNLLGTVLYLHRQKCPHRLRPFLPPHSISRLLAPNRKPPNIPSGNLPHHFYRFPSRRPQRLRIRRQISDASMRGAGGKDPAIILDSISDEDLEHRVLPILMKGTFVSSGQNCIGIERIIACPRAYAKLIPLLEKAIRALRLGSSLPVSTHTSETSEFDTNIDIGAMISSSSFPTLTNLISSAVSAGATLHCGGTPHKHPSHPSGHYFTPTFLSAITPSMPIAQNELFAPIALLFPATSVSHAIAIANSTSYALGASVFGSPSDPALKTCTREIRAGMVSVNDFGAYYAVGLPFGGRNGSGYGRFGGEEGLRGICNMKSVCRDRRIAKWCGVGTKIPAVLEYGGVKQERARVPQARKVAFLKGMMELGYAEGWARRGKGLWEMWRSG